MHFGSIHVLKNRERQGEALELLTRAAKQVQPIMKQRGWSVGQLSEFFPSNPNLLGININAGQAIKIRLRPARAPDSFYEWHDVLGTMLHELVHIVHGAHNAAFYKLLDELWVEAEALMDKGITGSGVGFDAPSAGRLGSHAFIPLHNPPEHRMADAIRKAAEARAKKQAIMLAGPRKLGGSSSRYRGMTPAQAAAAAAERRAADNLWCPAEHDEATLQQELGSDGGAADSSSSSGSGGAGRGAAVGVAAGAAGAAGKQPGGSGLVAAAPTAAVAAAAAGAAAAAARAAAAAAAVASAGGSVSGAAAQAAQPRPRRVDGTAQQKQQQSLQQGWQQHVQQRQQQRLQRLQSRKRPAAEAIDLTLSDDDNSDNADDGSCCPACAAAGPEVAAALAGARSNGFRIWCKRHQQQQQQQQALRGPRWACQACTLINPAGERQCQACQTEREE